MANVRIEPALLTTALVTKRVVGSSVTATLVELSFHNTDTVNRNIAVHFVPLAGSASDANLVIETGPNNALRPDETRVYEFKPALKTGDFIRAKADVASKVAMSGSVLEEAV